eukprot:scaffold6825_cov63-Skeletonema_menzelii.AAC.1
MKVDTSLSVDAVMVLEVRKERRADGVKEDAAVRAWARKDAMAKRIEGRLLLYYLPTFNSRIEM